LVVLLAAFFMVLSEIISVTIDDRNDTIWTLGTVLSKHLSGFYGSVQYNFQNGKLVVVNTTDSYKKVEPEKQEIEK